MHAINIISGISMLGVFFGSAALIIILSVFNGFEEVILSLYSNFSPELKIEARQGKTFNPDTPFFKQLRQNPKLASFTEVLEEKALVRYGDNKQFIGTVRGVSDDFLKNTRLDSSIQSGSFTIEADHKMYAVIGTTVQNYLSVNIRDQLTPLQIFSPRRETVNSGNPLDEFVVKYIYPSGIFSVQQEFDNMIITPIAFTRQLVNKPGAVSSIDLRYLKGTNIKTEQAAIKDKIGNHFVVRNRDEQNPELYKTLNYERWFIFMILTFVLIIAIFNIIGSLTMLVIEKRKDIAILTSLGAGKKLIQGIFFFEGMMISVIGCAGGILLGLIFCILQRHYGFIKMGSDLTVIDAYPVALKWIDFLIVFCTVTAIAVIASGISARLSVKRLDEIKQDL
jgi:lipoprotein-releasing system permease protein